MKEKDLWIVFETLYEYIYVPVGWIGPLPFSCDINCWLLGVPEGAIRQDNDTYVFSKEAEHYTDEYTKNIYGSNKPEPSNEELSMAETRIRALDTLEPFCDWDNPAPDYEAIRARGRWKDIMDRQEDFENKYC